MADHEEQSPEYEKMNALAGFILGFIDDLLVDVPEEDTTGDRQKRFIFNERDPNLTIAIYRAGLDSIMMSLDERIDAAELALGEDLSSFRLSGDQTMMFPFVSVLLLEKGDEDIWFGFKLEYYQQDGELTQLYRYSSSVLPEEHEARFKNVSKEEQVRRIAEQKAGRRMEVDLGFNEPSMEDLTQVAETLYYITKNVQ